MPYLRRIPSFRNGRKRVSFVSMGDATSATTQCQAGCVSIDTSTPQGAADSSACMSACSQTNQNACVTACNGISDPTNFQYCQSACAAIPSTVVASSSSSTTPSSTTSTTSASSFSLFGLSPTALAVIAVGAYIWYGDSTKKKRR
jgi:hypothetical protein